MMFDENGRFAKGNPGGPGRPTRDKEKAVLKAISAAASPEQVAGVIRDLMFDATSWRARQAGVELYLFYTEGKPIQRTQQLDNDTMSEFINDIAAKMKEEEQG